MARKFSGDSRFRRAVITLPAKLNARSDEADVAGTQHVRINIVKSVGYTFRCANHQSNKSKDFSFLG